jgi:hypothetical protein
MWPPGAGEDLRVQIDRPLAKPHAAVTANDAEAFFLLMKRVLWDGRMGRDRTAALLEYRRWGAAFAERYRDDGFVRCAFLRSEVAILSDHAVRVTCRRNPANPCSAQSDQFSGVDFGVIRPLRFRRNPASSIPP